MRLLNCLIVSEAPIYIGRMRKRGFTLDSYCRVRNWSTILTSVNNCETSNLKPLAAIWKAQDYMWLVKMLRLTGYWSNLFVIGQMDIKQKIKRSVNNWLPIML